MNNQKILFTSIIVFALTFAASAIASISFSSNTITSDGNINLRPADHLTAIVNSAAAPDPLVENFEIYSDAGSSDAYNTLTAVYLYAEHDGSGVVDEAYDLYVDSISNAGSGSITNDYGILIHGQNAGTNNYGIYIGATPSGVNNYNIYSQGTSTNNRFQGTVTVGPDESTLDPLLMGWTGGVNLFTSKNRGVTVGIESEDDVGLYVASLGDNEGIDVDSIIKSNGQSATSFFSTPYANGKAATTLTGYYAATPILGGGTLTNAIGIEVQSQTGATNNYAIKTGLGKVQFGDVIQSVVTTFSSLPTCNGTNEGSMRAISDSNTATWGATIAGSSTNHVLAYCNGTNWTVMGK